MYRSVSLYIVLIHSYFIFSYENPDDVLVVAGTTDRENLNGDHIYTIKGVVTHPDYDPKTVNNDIGLILLHGEIDFSLEDVKMIDLGTEPVPEGAKMILTGWGRLSASNPEKPKILQSLEVTAISSEVCSAQWGDFFHGNQICAFDKDQGSCHGDSGGPLVYKSVQVGIVSLGKPCALDKADVYTEVAKFLEFINGHIENNNALLY